MIKLTTRLRAVECSDLCTQAADRIEKLEAALIAIKDNPHANVSPELIDNILEKN